MTVPFYFRFGFQLSGFGDDFGDGGGFMDDDDFEAIEAAREGSVSMRESGVRGGAAVADASSRLEPARLDLDAPIPDDFGGQFDDNIFMGTHERAWARTCY